MKIVLATSSQFKSELLNNAHLFHVCMNSNFEEIEKNDTITVEELTKINARGKAKAVANQMEDGIVIGVDTVVSFNDKPLMKPSSLNQARDILGRLSGKSNKVITGICLIDAKTKKEIVTSEITTVYFKDIPEYAIDYYIHNEKWILDSSGYVIENILANFVQKIDGNFNNILGMPISTIYDCLQQFDFQLGSKKLQLK